MKNPPRIDDTFKVNNVRIFFFSENICHLSRKTRVGESEEETRRDGESFVRWVEEANFVCLRVIVGIHGKVDKHESVREEAEDGAEDDHRVAAPFDGQMTQETKQYPAHHLSCGNNNGTQGGQGLSVGTKPADDT